MWGEGVSVRPGDKYMTMVSFMANWGSTNSSSDWSYTGGGRYSDLASLDTSSCKSMARDYHQRPGLVGFRLAASSLSNRLGNGLVYPNRSDNGVYVQTEPLMVIVDGPDFRGFLPGVRNPLAYIAGQDKTVSKNLPNIPGKALLNLMVAGVAEPSSSSQTMICFDITGPWR